MWLWVPTSPRSSPDSELGWLGKQSLLDCFPAMAETFIESLVLDYTDEHITRADKRERFLAKTAVLGLQYGMGAIKYIGTCRAQENIKVDLGEATKVVGVYRDTYSHIPSSGTGWTRCWKSWPSPGLSPSWARSPFDTRVWSCPTGCFSTTPTLKIHTTGTSICSVASSAVDLGRQADGEHNPSARQRSSSKSAC